MFGVTRRLPRVLQLAGLPVCGGALLVPVTACATEAAPKMVTVAETRVPFPVASDVTPRVDRPYFAPDGRLRWDDTVIHVQPTGACDTVPPGTAPGGAPLRPRRNRLQAPRVDERRCPRAGGPGTEGTLVGIDGSGAATWQRPLAFDSGGRPLEQWLIGASPDGLVVSSLEVWSPATGQTVVPARTHPAGPDSRPVPSHQFQHAAAYDPRRRQVYVFDADVTLVRRAGGLHRFDPGTGALELIQDVSAGWTGTYDRVEAMALTPDGRHLLLARQRSTRGPASVSLAVFDLDARQTVFEAEHGKGHHCSDPQVIAGPAGVGFAYRDANTAEHVLVHYRMEDR
jgi:hypothetical protein